MFSYLKSRFKNGCNVLIRAIIYLENLSNLKSIVSQSKVVSLLESNSATNKEQSLIAKQLKSVQLHCLQLSRSTLNCTYFKKVLGYPLLLDLVAVLGYCEHVCELAAVEEGFKG